MNIKTIVVAALAAGGALGVWAEENVTYATVRRNPDAQRVNVVEFTAKAETTAVVEAKVAVKESRGVTAAEFKVWPLKSIWQNCGETSGASAAVRSRGPT